MLIVLWDALFLSQSEDWCRRGVANTKADETLELARWFLRGQKVGSTPIFNGICSQCGTLLHGDINKNSALSNKTIGPPCDRDGTPLINPDGTARTDAQPPFLLRYSPALFAREAGDMFEYDAETNRLSLKEGVAEPWIRPPCPRYTENTKTWLYCLDCKARWFPDPGQRMHSHIPFRDRASQCMLKPVRRSRNYTATQPEEEPLLDEEDPVPPVEEEPVDEEMPDLPDPPEDRPTLEQYREKWDRLLAQHSKENPGEFGRQNLVPKPDPRLWQDCPYS